MLVKWTGNSHAQRGVGMIEVLVALLVISIGVLGYAGLQLRALNSTDDAQFRSQAVALANDAVERMRVNAIDTTMEDDQSTPNDEREKVNTWYATATDWPDAAMDNTLPATWNQCVDGNCAAADLAAWDRLQLRWQAWNLLPQGRMRVEPCTAAANSNLCVRVVWNDTTLDGCDPTANDCVVLEAGL